MFDSIPAADLDRWNRKTVVVDLHSGLGNQMFHMAFGLAVARKFNLALEWTWRGDPLRRFSMDLFGFRKPQPWAPPIVYASSEQGDKNTVDVVGRAIEIAHNPLCGIRGIFENEACFLPVADEVRRLYALPAFDLSDSPGTPVAIQVRRTDFLKSRTHDVCTAKYFRNAIDQMSQLVPDAFFHLVSDDPAWCATAFERIENKRIHGSTPTDDLRVMVACKAHIISNSTFGWWGAWLSGADKVIVPSVWKRAPFAHVDAAPARWFRVPI